MNFLGLHLSSNSIKQTQQSLDIIAQNISNADVQGYCRQEARQEIVVSGNGFSENLGTISVGSEVTDIVRYKDDYLTNNYRREELVNGELTSLSTYLDEASEIFTDEADFGVPQLLNTFWQGWNEAARNPKDLAIRNMVIGNGTNVAQSLRMKGNKINEMANRLDSDIRITVSKINNIAQELASINDQVIPSEQNNFNTNLLQDKRDLLLDELSKMADVHIIDDGKGSINVSLDGAPLVAQKFSFPITLEEDAAHNFIFKASNGRELNIRGGDLKGFMDMKTDYIPSYQSELDALATKIIDEVNALHNVGYGLDGTTGLDFFTGTGASDIQVSLNVKEHLALSAGKMVSTSNINIDGSQVLPDKTILEEQAKFKTPPAASGTIHIENGAITADINWTNADSLSTILAEIKKQTGIEAQFDYNSQKLTLNTSTAASTFTITDVPPGPGGFTTFTNLSGASVSGGETGDGTNGLNLFELSTKDVFGTPPSVTINDKYKNLVADVGFDTNNVKNKQELQEKYVESLDSMRQEESGISIDEELIKLLRYQRQFQASATLSSVMNDTIQSLFDMVR